MESHPDSREVTFESDMRTSARTTPIQSRKLSILTVDEATERDGEQLRDRVIYGRRRTGRTRRVRPLQTLRNVTVFNSFYVALQTGVSIVTASAPSWVNRLLALALCGKVSNRVDGKTITTYVSERAATDLIAVYDGAHQ